MPPARASNTSGRKKSETKSSTGKNTEEEYSYSDSCLFCEESDDDEEIFGRKVLKCGITVHYFCMLFSSGLSQRGKTENDGIYGFLPSDIGKEKIRGARLRCTFCRKNGATIGCVVKNCRKVFHFGCGQREGALNQYFDSYRSFCTSHRPRQTCPVSDRLSFYGTANSMCVICMSAVEARASNETLRAPCCKNTWFHRKCIQRQALAAGLYLFKCPLCCNKEIFQAEMLQVGIYIPEQDAAWEMEPHAYQELLEPYNHCDMDSCMCPRGRKYNRDESKWEIVVCHWCGSQGSHIGCFSKRTTPSSSKNIRWSCQSCALIDTELRKERKKKSPCPPVNQESADMPMGKSPTPSKGVGRKLPVKRSSPLGSPSEVTEQNTVDSSTDNTPPSTSNQSSGSLTPRSRRRRKRNLWARGVLLRNSTSGKKRKVISATVTLAEASQAPTETSLAEQSPSQQVNTENVNPMSTEKQGSLGSASGSEATCSSQLTDQTNKKGDKTEPEVLSEIRNNKLCDTAASRSAHKLTRRALSYSTPYGLRGRKNSDISPSPSPSPSILPYLKNRRSLRSNKTIGDVDFTLSWKQGLSESPFKSAKQKFQDGNNNSELCLSSDINKTCFTLAKDSESQLLSCPPRCSSPSPLSPSPSAYSAVEISRESQSASCVSPTFDKCLTKNGILLDKENSKVIERMVDCDCISCSNFIIIPSDNESDAGQDNMIMSVSLSENDPNDNSSLTMMSVSMNEGESGNIPILSHLQEQKCDEPNCDCHSSSFVYPTQLLSLSNDDEFSASASGYGIEDSFQLAAMKEFIESTPRSAPSSPLSSSSVITLASSSDYESCKSSNEMSSTACPFEVTTIM